MQGWGIEPAAGRVVGVVGGSGGVGASTFAAVLSAAGGPAVLVDLDVGGGGVDVLLSVDDVPGARWSGLRVAGGRLDPELLSRGLPHAGTTRVLAADVPELDPGAVLQVIDAATALGTVVLDLPRAACPARTAGLSRCDLVVVVVRADVSGLVAAHATIDGLVAAHATIDGLVAAHATIDGAPAVAGEPVPGAVPEPVTGVVVRRVGGAPGAAEAAELVGAPLLGVLPRGIASGRVASRRAVQRLAAGILAGLTSAGVPALRVVPPRAGPGEPVPAGVVEPDAALVWLGRAAS